MCMAAANTVAQVRRVVDPGEICPETIVTPGIFVNAIVSVPTSQQEEVLIRAGNVYS